MHTEDLQAQLLARLRKLAADRGTDVATLLEGPDPLDPDGWNLPDPEKIALRLENADLALRNVGGAEYSPDRLPEINRHVERWVQLQLSDPQQVPFLVLQGTVGCGKTSQLFVGTGELARGYARRNQALDWQFTTHRNFAAEIRPGGDDDPEAALRKYMTARLTGLDDLGDYNTQDFGRAVDATVRLINHRYQHKLAMICTTNLPFRRSPEVVEAERVNGVHIATLADTLDGRVLSRLESGWQIVLPEVDHRMRAGQRFFG